MTPRAGPLRDLATAVAVAVAYYAGSWVGLLLELAPLAPSVLWPPNAILSAALLLTQPRRWWLWLLAALPAHLAVQLGSGRPGLLVLALFLTNCSEALMAAGSARWFGLAGPALFTSLRAVGVFIVGAGFLAPFASSFLAAAAVTPLAGQDYWPVWQTRFFSNALTALTLVPALVMLAARGPAWLRRGPDRRALEAVLVWLGVLGCGLAIFDGRAGVMGVVVLLALPFALLLSLLVWAAVRLGPTGTSVSVLTVELLAIHGARHGHMAFDVPSPAAGVLSLQIFLIGVAIPLLCLAALIEERQRSQEALEARLSFEELLSRLSRAFVHLPSDEVDRTIDGWLRRLGEHLGSDHMAIYQLAPNDRTLVATHAWSANGGVPRNPAAVPDPDGLYQSPLMITDLGVISFGARQTGEPWPAPMIPQLRLVAEIFANAITRKQAESALRASEFIKTAVLGSLTSGVAVLDRQARVVAVNEAWHRLGHRGGEGGGLDVGATAADVCTDALGPGSVHAGEARAAIQAVIAGARADVSLEYPRAAPGGERWFALAVLPLARAEGGAVVSLTDITGRKRAEREAQRTREELAHFTRVSTVGELTASLAHELSQPLTGILANAQAAQRLLAADPPDVAEVRASLADIVADDRRAGDIIRRLRELLKKGAPQRLRLDLNVVVEEVVKLVHSDALSRGVRLEVDADRALPPLHADRVQLQQVVLNLLMNAMEAMAATPAPARRVRILTRRLDAATAAVAVEDAGSGLAPDAAERIFEPFYTTKPDGMGMGLAIARSIVEAHNGRLWATGAPGGGAVFHFTVPLASPEHA